MLNMNMQIWAKTFMWEVISTLSEVASINYLVSTPNLASKNSKLQQQRGGIPSLTETETQDRTGQDWDLSVSTQ